MAMAMVAMFFTRHATLLMFFLSCLVSFSTSCPIYPSCDPSIQIWYPFYTNSSIPGCNGTYLIGCNGSRPILQFPDYLQRNLEYTVKNINYSEKTITLQYQDFTTSHPNSNCSFLYSFTRPIPSFDRPHPPILDSLDRSLSTCSWGEDDFHLLKGNYNYSVCNDFNLYYRDEAGNNTPKGVSSACQAPKAPPLFQLKLSFDASVDGLSLLWAGFSPSLVLRPECFQDRVLCSIGSALSKESRKPKIIGSTVGSVGFISIILLLAYVLHSKFWHPQMKIVSTEKKVEAFLEKYGSLAPKRYTYSDVKKITKSFRNKLGQGGYGSVFKGGLEDGRLVAVKVLTNSKGNGEEFVNEIASIGRSSHVNIVNLLGFCSEGSKRALIYEFMSNGSLDKLISSEAPKTTLHWEKLYQIAIGIARGLEYLHRGSNTRIVHFDIKPHNILLDEDFRPKISDFGLAKLCLRKDSILSMQGFRGTIGYIAPEVFSRHFGVVSSKSDIYSYGMMVLEMAGGRMDMHGDAQDTSENNFPHSIYKHLQDNGDLQAYGVMAETEEMARKMILIGLWCIQTLPQHRPSITRVIEMLEGSIDDLQVPPEPYLSSPPPPPPLGPLEATSSVDDSTGSNC